jgi:hypothetical protein
MPNEWLPHEANMYQVRETFASVPANTTSARQTVPISTFGGTLIQVQFSTANVVESDFAIFQHATNLSGSVDEIYRVTGLTQFWQKENHAIRFFNADSPRTTNLYLEVTNQSLVAPSGTITLILWLAKGGSRGAI